MYTAGRVNYVSVTKLSSRLFADMSRYGPRCAIIADMSRYGGPLGHKR